MTNKLVHVQQHSPVVIDGEIMQVKTSPLTQADYEAIKTALVKGKVTDTRNLILCQVLRGTGLRITEVLRLTPQHVRMHGIETGILIKRGKKRGKDKEAEWVPLQPSLGVALRNYITGQRIGLEDRIFGIRRRQVNYIFEEAGKEAIGRAVHPHEFRDLYVKTLIDGGLTFDVASVMVGHADPKTTRDHYYDLTREERFNINRGIPI